MHINKGFIIVTIKVFFTYFVLLLTKLTLWDFIFSIKDSDETGSMPDCTQFKYISQ